MSRSLFISMAFHAAAALLLLWGAGRLVSSPSKPSREMVSVDLVVPAPPQAPVVRTAHIPVGKPSIPSARKKPASSSEAAAAEKGAAPSPVLSGKATGEPATPEGVSGQGTFTVAVQDGAGGSKAGAAGGTVEGREGPGAVVGSGGAGDRDYGAEFAEIRERVEKAARRSYPPKARRLGMEGTVVVRFSVGRSGSPEEIDVVAACGHETLNDAAVEIIRNAGPYPYVPEPVQIPIRFSLERS